MTLALQCEKSELIPQLKTQKNISSQKCGSLKIIYFSKNHVPSKGQIKHFSWVLVIFFLIFPDFCSIYNFFDFSSYKTYSSDLLITFYVRENPEIDHTTKFSSNENFCRFPILYLSNSNANRVRGTRIHYTSA